MRHAGKVSQVVDCIRSTSPTVAAMHREKGRDFTEAYVSLWLIYLNEILNLKKSLTEPQIELCAQTIVNEYYALKVADLTLLAKRIISGHYGDLYESLTINKVLTFFSQYIDERLDTAADESLREHQDRMSDDTFNFSSSVKRLYQDRSTKGFSAKNK